MKISAGTRLGRYEIRSKIGEGGMGEVYRALDTELDRTVALKILPAELSSNLSRMQRFIQEAKSASALNHPHIVTIYEIGNSAPMTDGSGGGEMRFIAMELIDGETLCQRIRHGQLKLSELLEIAIQTAGALAAAHTAGIVHRDIKPENIMLRPDGYIKILDFGLAKLTEPLGSPTDTEAPTKALVNTGAGTVLGTANYMSPEQAKGKRIDARTDLWSLGAVIYEMVTGHAPFEAETPSEVIGLILNKEPPPMARYERAAPPELERIVEKMLTKNRDERYQTAKDLLVDLKRLRRQLELEAEIERTVPPEIRTSSSLGTDSSVPAPTTSVSHTTAGAMSAEGVHHASSAEYIVNEIKRHKKAFVLVAAGVLALVLATIGYFIYARRAAALTDKDTILLTDFVNTTGDPVFDGALKQALAVQLGQSPFLNIFGDDRVRDALRFMGRSPDERVTRDVGRELCLRQGVKALLTGSISSLGSHYVITLEAINAQTGDAIAREQAEAESKEQVLKKLGEAATSLREKLGESLASIQKFDAPVEQATTSSLEALKAFSMGTEERNKGRQIDALRLFKQAIVLDPNFAVAYARLASTANNLAQDDQATESAQKAFDLRERVSERERFYIEYSYYSVGTRQLDKTVEVCQLWTQTYPRDVVAHNSLGFAHSGLGHWEQSAEEFREVIQLTPNSFVGYSNLTESFARLNRFEEAKAIAEQALARKLETLGIHRYLFEMALIRGDKEAMRQQVESTNGKSFAYGGPAMQAQAAAFSGELRNAREYNRQATGLLSDRKELAANILSEEALDGALFGYCQQAKEDAASALAVEHTIPSRRNAALVSALCGDTAKAQGLIDESVKKYPKDTVANAVWIPAIRAAIEINHDHPAQAVQLLEPANAYENADLCLAHYLRGLAYLQQHAGVEAMAQFQYILDHSGTLPTSVVHPLSELSAGRAATLQGDTTKARKAYQDFFALWKDADQDVPILIEAKKEYAQLK